MKMIELSEDHYIVVDDSQIVVGDWCYRDTEVVFQATKELLDYYNSINSKHKVYKITHSTQPIERWFQSLLQVGREYHSYVQDIDFSIRKGFGKIQQLSLLEVKELLGEDTDVWSRKLEYLKKVNEDIKHKSQDERIWIFGASDLGFTAGYNQALEDNRGKKYTEEDITEAILRTIDACNEAQKNSYGELEIDEEAIIQSLQPKTGWDVEFNEHGKLTLV